MSCQTVDSSRQWPQIKFECGLVDVYNFGRSSLEFPLKLMWNTIKILIKFVISEKNEIVQPNLRRRRPPK